MLQARSRVQQERWAVNSGAGPRPLSRSYHRSQPVSVPRARPRTRRRGKVKLFLIGLACLVLSLVVIAQYCRIVSLGFELSTQETRIKELKEEYRELETASARLASLSRIEEVARGELGMREPDRGQLKVLTASLE